MALRLPDALDLWRARGRFSAAEFLYLGAPEPWEPMDSLLWGEIGNEAVSIRANSDETHAIGERVHAYFQPKRASLFDAETGVRL